MTAPRKPPHVLMLVGDTIAKSRRTGIQRVVIETARRLAALSREDLGPFDLVRWDPLEGRLRFLDQGELDQMFGPGDWPQGLNLRPEARNVGRPFRDHLAEPDNTWLLIPEVGWHELHGIETTARAAAHCRGWGGRSAAIFYDLIPVRNPDYAGGAEKHEAYLAELMHVDLIVPISAAAGDDLAALWRERGVVPHPPIRPLLLPDGGFGGARGDGGSRPGRTLALFGTVEPRKRQLEFLKAMEAARRSSGEVAKWRAVVVGSLHHATAKAFKAMVQRCDWIEHHDYVTDARLAEILGEAEFTVFASEDEGYGLPIAESLAFGAPCLCADFGAMAEIAAGGGCLTVDVRDLQALEKALTRLCEDHALVASLRAQIARRPFKSWTDYARGLVGLMEACERGPAADPVRVQTIAAEGGDEAFRQAAEADIATYAKVADEAAFIAAAVERVWPALLPELVPVKRKVAAADVLGRARLRRRVTAETERAFAKARQAVPGGKPARQVFLRVLISTYNRRDFVVANVRWILGKVLAGVSAPVDLVVVDGGSTDGTVEALYRIYDTRLRVVECPANVGMLAGIREAAREVGAEYVWLVGDDDFIDPEAFDRMVEALKAKAGVPFAFTNFSVYQRGALSPMDTPDRLMLEGRPVAEGVAPSGLVTVGEAAAQTDNLFTAIYAIVWRADVLSAAYERAFDGAPFESLAESIPCTEYILGEHGDSDAWWHAPSGIVGNAHNSWSRHRLLWHGAVMPLALALAREAGVDPVKLQTWAEAHGKLFAEARGIAAAKGWPDSLDDRWRDLALRVFRRRLPGIGSS